MYGRSRGLVTPIDADFAYGYIQTRIMMTFPDPRYYSSTGTSVSGSGVFVSNSGWATSCPVITVASPSSSGRIYDINGTEMIFQSVTSGPLVIDLLSRVIYVAGVPTRPVLSASTNGWLDIAPNSVNYWISTIGSFSTTYRNAYV
jgi:hypothetical protein